MFEWKCEFGRDIFLLFISRSLFLVFLCLSPAEIINSCDAMSTVAGCCVNRMLLQRQSESLRGISDFLLLISLPQSSMRKKNDKATFFKCLLLYRRTYSVRSLEIRTSNYSWALFVLMPNRRLSVGKFTELNKKKKTGAEEVNQCRLQIHLVCFNGKWHLMEFINYKSEGFDKDIGFFVRRGSALLNNNWFRILKLSWLLKTLIRKSISNLEFRS